jgi:hypothetical protein
LKKDNKANVAELRKLVGAEGRHTNESFAGAELNQA